MYTGTGDGGQTSTLRGDRVSKNSPVIRFAGEADELNCQLGLVKAMTADAAARAFLEEIQKKLMTIMAHACDPCNGEYLLAENETAVLEKEIDRLSRGLPQKFEFVLPGKSVLEAQIHIARTAARRAERGFTALSEQQPPDKNALSFLNRLSSYLFVLSQSVR
jgi:cob(I)alamin adenosyltransferase